MLVNIYDDAHFAGNSREIRINDVDAEELHQLLIALACGVADRLSAEAW